MFRWFTAVVWRNSGPNVAWLRFRSVSRRCDAAPRPGAPSTFVMNNLTLSVQTGGAIGAGPYAAAKGAL